jgi:hypothetical protein
MPLAGDRRETLLAVLLLSSLLNEIEEVELPYKKTWADIESYLKVIEFKVKTPHSFADLCDDPFRVSVLQRPKAHLTHWELIDKSSCV